MKIWVLHICRDGDYINNTKSAVVLEDLIAKFLYNSSVGDEANAQ